MSWNQEKISDVAIIGDGAHASIKRAETGVPYLTSKNFKAEGLDLTKLDFISESDYQKHFKEKSKALTKPQENDLVVGIIGTLGSPYLVRKTDRFGLSSSVAILRPDSKKILPQYLLYWMKSPTFQHSINQIKSGVAQSFLSLGMIGSLPVNYPQSLDIQQRIARILAAYDDLIENNLKRIKLLEEMARVTYEEWFVRLRFPGHESTPINPETGLPKGWTKEPLGKHLKFIKGKKVDELFTEYTEGLVRIMLLDSLESGNFKFTTPDKHVSTKRGDLVMCMDGARSSYVFYTEDGIVGSTMAKIEANALPVSLLYLFFKSILESLQTNNTGAAIPHANKAFINSIEFPIPSVSVLQQWDLAVSKLNSQVWNLRDQNQRLREARDILLPRLMTGVIDVESYDPAQLLKEAA